LVMGYWRFVVELIGIHKQKEKVGLVKALLV
jgi:hypothetical protein